MLQCAQRNLRQASVPEEIPESRLRNDFIGRKDAHTVDFWVGIICGGQVTTDDLVFLKAHLRTYSAHIQTERVKSIKRSSFRARLLDIALWMYNNAANKILTFEIDLILRRGR